MKQLIVYFTTVFSIVVHGLDTWEDVHIICPNQCVCQHSHFMDLSIARWTEGLNSKYAASITTGHTNEAYFENDSSHTRNPFLKFTMCMLQDNGNIKDVIISLPPDVQALVFLYNGIDKNVTMMASDLLSLTELTILEIRGTIGQGLQFILDASLPLLQYANFEMIELVGTENARKNKNSVHPSEVFDYVPESEKGDYNISLEINEEIQIVPYEVYLMEKKKSKMASFDGWKELAVLRIHSCKLDELHWEMFDGLTTLEHLSLEHNDIKIVPPFAFYGAMHIKTLSLARNSILDLNYRALAGLLDLEWLNLSNNNLTKLSEVSFPPFPKLKTVDFRDNPIKYIFPMTFGVMNTTKHIYIGSKVVALDLSTGSSFRSLTELKTLFILNGTATVLNQNIFKGLKQLETLKMHGDFKRVEFDAFAEMPYVKELILSDCGIQDISMDSFYGVKQLEIVDLSNNKLQSLPPGLFEDQNNIKEIYLQLNQLSNLPKDFFNNTSVKLIRLTENPWICSCDMTSWKQAITNRQRSGKTVPNCLRDIKTGKVLRCSSSKTEYIYTFDNKLSPRCDGGPSDVQYRSVYYTLRKSMQCSPKKTVNVKNVKYIMQNNYLRNKQKLDKLNYSLKSSKDKSQKSLKEMRQDRFRTKYRKTFLSNELKNALKNSEITTRTLTDSELNEFILNHIM